MRSTAATRHVLGVVLGGVCLLAWAARPADAATERIGGGGAGAATEMVRTARPTARAVGSRFPSPEHLPPRGGAHDPGSLAGQVTTTAMAPLANVTVQVLDATGAQVGSPVTDAAGSFRVDGLAPGTYYARTNNQQGYIDELYDSITWRTWEWAAGTPIAVASGATASIAFQLDLGGRLGGRFTESAGGAAIAANVWVDVFDAVGRAVASGATVDASGNYLSPALAPGTYYVRSRNTAMFVDELYNNLPFWTPVTAGQAVVVAQGATTPGIDFALAAGGRVTGRITDAVSGLALTDQVWADFFDTAGRYVGSSGWPDAGGTYQSSGLPPGTYYARTNSNRAHVNEVYRNLPVWTTVTSGTPIAVAAGGTTSGIDFTLDAGGRIAGSVTDAATGLPVVAGITAFDSSNRWVARAESDGAGHYTLPGLPAGSYYLVTDNASGYVDQVYDGIPCPGCTPTSGAPVPVTVGATTSGIDFALTAGGRIAGRVTEAGAGTALGNVTLDVFDRAGVVVARATTDGTGAYRSPLLVAGTYYLRTQPFGAYVQTAYQNQVCVGCSVMATTPVTVTATETTGNIDFALVRGGQISGRVTDATTGANLAGVPVEVFDSSGASLGWSSSTDAAGFYTTFGLPAAIYYVRTNGSHTHVNELYHDLPFGTNVTGGSGVSVLLGAVTNNVNFALMAGGRISGRLTDATTGQPVANGSVSFYNTIGQWLGSAQSDGSGNYLSPGLPAGTCFVRTDNIVPYIRQVYNNQPCPNCNVTTAGTGVPVTVGSTTPNIDFALVAGGRITGRILDGSGQGVPGGWVSVHNSNGASLGWGTNADASGAYTAYGLPAGSYYVKGNGGGSFVDELYDNIVCLGCAVTSGTPVAVVLGAATSGIDFALEAGGAITGTVAGPAGPVAFTTVRIFNGANANVRSVSTNAAGVYRAGGLPTGTYYVRTSNTVGLVDVLYNGVVCPGGACQANTGTGVAVTAPQTTSGIDFALSVGGSITGTVTDAANGTPLVNVTVRVYNGSNAQVGAATTNASGVYTVVGLAAGTYYARTADTPMHVVQLHTGIACPNANCTPSTGTGIVVALAQATTGVDFALGRSGAVSGIVSDAGTGAGLAGVTVRVYNPTNGQVASATTNTSGVYTASGLPPGQVYVRTSNSLGYTDQLYAGRACPMQGCTPNTGTPVGVTAGSTTGGIDFALAQGGALSGRVTSAVDGSGLSGINLTAYDPSSNQVASVTTNASGNYAFNGMLAGQYYVKTTNAWNQGFIDGLHSGLPCPGGVCVPGAGAPVTVTVGGNATADFVLARGATIRGTVTGNGGPLSGVAVAIFDADGQSIASVNTAADGTYSVAGLPTGTYYAQTNNAANQGFANQVYAGQSCFVCLAVAGTPIAATVGQVTSGIDFALVGGARITGVATDGGNPVSGLTITLFAASGRSLGTRTTDGTGGFGFSGLPAGTYFLQTSGGVAGYLNQVYRGRACGGAGCDTVGGTPVTVAAGQMEGNVHFAMQRGSSIRGTVTNGAVPLANVSVTAYPASRFGTYQSVATDAQGMYTISGLPAGAYYVRTSVYGEYVSQLYNGLTCPSCQNVSGDQVWVAADAVTGGINFVLTRGVGLTGRVTDGVNPLADVTVSIHAGQGVTVASVTTNAAGEYGVAGLTPGTYYARTTNAANQGFVDEAYSDAVCPVAGCAPLAGTPIQVTSQGATGVDFALARGGQITGFLMAGTTALRNQTVRIFNGAGVQVASPRTNNAGFYAQSGLPPGSYYLRASASGFPDLLFDGVPCPGGSCSVWDGTPVVVTSGGTARADLRFSRTGASISGNVTGGGAPLANVNVVLHASNGAGAFSTWTDATGAFTFAGLAAGTYYLRTSSQLGFVDALYGGTPCAQGYCDPATGTAITLANGEARTGVGIALVMGSTITGRVVGTSGAPIPDLLVFAFTSKGKYGAYGWVEPTGIYTIRGLPADTYHVTVSRGFHQGFLNELFDDLADLYGDVTTGTPVPLGAGVVRSGIDFSLPNGGVISGRVTDGVTTLPLADVAVSVADSTGRRLLSVPTSPDGRYTVAGLPTGSYYVYTDNVLGYQNQAYNGGPCPFWPCLGSATSIPVTAGSTAANVNLVLQPGSRIEGRVTDAVSQAGAGGVEVLVLDAAGTVVGNARSDPAGRYVTNQGLAAGTYYARTSPVPGFAVQQYNGKTCPGGTCPPAGGDAIAVVAGSRTSGVDFALARCGTLTLGPMQLPDAVRGAPYSATFTAAGGAAPYGYSVAEVDGWGPGEPTPGSRANSGFRVARGVLPPGLTLDAATGVLSGAVTRAGDYWFVIGAVDNQGCSVSRLYELWVDAAAVTVTWPAPAPIVYGTPLGVTQLNASASVPGTFEYTPAAGTVLPVGTSTLSVVFTPTDTATYRSVGRTVPITVTQAGTVGLTVTSPNGGENWFMTSRHAITWNSTGWIANVKIEASANGGASWFTAVSSTPNTGSYTVHVSGTPSAQYLVRISDASNPAVFDVSDAVFTLSTDTTEPNNTSGGAFVLPLGQTDTLLWQGAGERDWYKFFVPPALAGQDLRVNVRVLSDYPVPPPAGWGSDLDFELLDGSLRVLGVAMSASDNETLYLHDVASGWYYIDVGYCSTDYADDTGLGRYAVTIEAGTSFGVGYVTGRIVASGSGTGIGGVFVRVQPSPYDWSRTLPTMTTNPDGSFAVAVGPGTHDVFLTGRENISANQPAVNVVDEYYQDRANVADADHVTVASGVTLDLGTITMDVGAIVSGRVTNASGTPLNNATIWAYDVNGNGRSTGSTDASGNYTLPGVPVGHAIIRASRSGYGHEYYQNASTFGAAASLATTAGGALGGIDFQLDAGGTVTGYVRDARGFGIAVAVRLYSVLDGTYSRATVTSDSDSGRFEFTRVLPGDYVIWFNGAGTAYVSEWFADAATFETATRVTVTNGGTVSGVIASLADAVPEITLAQGSTPIANGGAHGFGARTVGTSTDVVFTVGNVGTANLTLSGLPLVIGGADADQFAVVGQPASPVTPAGTTTFSVRFNPTSAGEKTAQISLANNDGDENPFVLVLTGTGVAAPTPTATVRVVDTTGGPGATVNVPIELLAHGDENAIGFSLTFDPSVITYPSPAPSPMVTVGGCASGAVANVNAAQAAAGRLGVTLALPAGQHFAAGTCRFVLVPFVISAAATGTPTPIAFGDQPIVREVSDATANPLVAAWTGGTLTPALGYEADVAPRGTGGNNAVTVTDWVQVGRFAAALDALTPGWEFQKADCAPRATLGGGTITISDWVQAGRYAAGLDPVTPTGGPTGAASGGAVRSGPVPTNGGTTAVSLENATAAWGGTITLPVLLGAQGVENAVGVSLTFDPTRLTYLSATLGGGASTATLNVNDASTAAGRIGLALALPSGQVFGAGTVAIVAVTFRVTAGIGTTTTSVEFGDQPIVREVSDALAGVVTATYRGAVVTLAPQVPFSDDPPTARVTAVKAVHITELRQRIDALRARFALAPYGWTDPVLSVGATPVRAAHLTDLRAAVAAVYAAAGWPPPVWAEPAIVGGTTVITAPHITELRAAVLAIW